MTRQDFIDKFILEHEYGYQTFKETLNAKLALRNEFRTYADEEADIEEFAQNSKNFIMMKLVTPFGEHPVFVDRSMHKEVMEYVREDYMGGFKGLKLKESL